MAQDRFPRFTISPAANTPGGTASARADALAGRDQTSANILPLHRGARVLQTTIERRYAEQGKHFSDEADAAAADDADAVSWSMLGGAAVLGFVAGMLVVLVPALLLAAVLA
jgi:hypothetical protein